MEGMDDSEATRITTPRAQEVASSLEHRLPAESSFGPYRIERLLGRGGMGEVYEAIHLVNGHRLALKILPPESAWSQDRLQRFLREGALAASISHPNSLFVYGTEEINGAPTIAMEIAPGGTLKDLVEKQGPMEVGKAVDAALEIAAGLAAAQAKGILHRDVKPANCFVDALGHVKVGDYGLALPESDPESTRMTMVGSLTGTPAFASPEQLRGEDLDARADIYSVGATLYFLLTGKTPFSGHTPMQMLAVALSTNPASPGTLNSAIPKGLSKIILRCLAKTPAERFADYGGLSAALEGYGSAVPKPASRWDRFRSEWFDICCLVFLPMVVLLMSIPGSGAPVPSESGQLLEISVIVAYLCYFGLWEGLRGRTPGQMLVGTRVIRPGGGLPGIPRALLLNLTYLAAYVVMTLVPSSAKIGIDGKVSVLGYLMQMGILIYGLAMFIPARRENGYAAIHDRLSGLRMVRMPARQRQLRSALEVSTAETKRETKLDPDVLPDDSVRSLGPFKVRATESPSAGMTVWADDPTLKRQVWIHVLSSEEASTSAARRDLVRPGRLRWIHGMSTPELRWDAYEAVSGAPFTMGIREPVAWGTVRGWLLDLAEELAASSADGSTPGLLTPERIFLSSNGRALLLDCPPPGMAEQDIALRYPSSPSTLWKEAQAFLSGVARSALAGGSGRPAALRPAGPLPLHGWEILRRLEVGGYASWDDLTADLRQAMAAPSEVSRPRRLVQWVATIACLLLMAFAGVSAVSSRDEFTRGHHELATADRALSALAPTNNERPVTPQDRRTLEILLTGSLRGSLGDSALAMREGKPYLRDRDVRRWRQLQQSLPEPSSDSSSWAVQTLQVSPRWKYLFDFEEASPVSRMGTVFQVFIVILALCFPIFLLLAVIFRGGVGFALMRFSLVTAGGDPASRSRIFFRSVVTFAPIVIAAVVEVISIKALGADFDSRALQATAFIALLVFTIGAGYALRNPSRGLQDRIAGTWIVPK